MFKVTLELPDSIKLRTLSGGKVLNWNVKALEKQPGVLSNILIGGGRITLTNAFNSGGKDTPESVRVTQAQKRMDSWERGEYVMVERGESQYTAMSAVWIDDYRAEFGVSEKAVRDFIKDSVTETFGKDAKATFSNFIDVMAKNEVANGNFESVGDARVAIEASLSERVAEVEADRAKVAKKLELPKMDLAKFKKAAK